MNTKMFALSALCAAVAVSASAGIESDVVGYAKSDLQSGYTLVVPQFSDVDGATFNLANFQPVGEDCYNNVFVSTFDSYGAPIATYGWTDCGGEDWDTPDVWVDTDDNSIVTDIPLLPGQAIFVQGSSSEQGLQSAGKVRVFDVALQLQSGYTIGGNPFPVDTTLGEVLPSGTDLYNNIFASTLDSYGAPIKTYGWTDCGGEDWDVSDVWVDTDDNTVVTDIEIKAGAGLFVQGSSSDQYLNFAAPEL